VKDVNFAVNKLTIIFKVFSWVAAALGVTFSVVILIQGAGVEYSRVLSSVLALIFGVIYFVFFYTLAEAMRLLVAIERNTRKHE